MIIIIKLFIIAIPLAIFGIIAGNLLSNSPQGIDKGSVQGKKTQVATGNSNKYLGNSINKLQQVEEKTKNKEIKNQVSEIIEEEVQSDLEITTSIATMEARPSYVKFIMGPDYKNAGQVRSEIVHLRNQISKLGRVQEKAGASESGTIAETITTLQAELTTIETTLYNNLQGFSLFGWLSKLLSGFTLTLSPSSLPSPEATSSGSPIPSVEPTATPVESGTPSAVPSATP